MGCRTDDIDVSPSAFAALANLDAGNIQVDWNWV
jgi:expansin (peptidoglycan-binding protein)